MAPAQPAACSRQGSASSAPLRQAGNLGASAEHGAMLGHFRQYRNSNLPCSRQLPHLTS